MDRKTLIVITSVVVSDYPPAACHRPGCMVAAIEYDVREVELITHETVETLAKYDIIYGGAVSVHRNEDQELGAFAIECADAVRDDYIEFLRQSARDKESEAFGSKLHGLLNGMFECYDTAGNRFL